MKDPTGHEVNYDPGEPDDDDFDDCVDDWVDDEVDGYTCCKCGRNTCHELCGNCDGYLCPMCFECGGGYCNRCWDD